jgi:hypothetical protein
MLSTLCRMRQRFVLAGQSRRGHLGNHETGVDAAVAHQETAATATCVCPSSARYDARSASRFQQWPAPCCRRPWRPVRRGSYRRTSHRPVLRIPAGYPTPRWLRPTSTSAAWRNWVRQAPITCGWQRREYGSCTLSQLLVRQSDTSLLFAQQVAVSGGGVDLPTLAARGMNARVKRRARTQTASTVRLPVPWLRRTGLRLQTGRAARRRWTPACH